MSIRGLAFRSCVVSVCAGVLWLLGASCAFGEVPWWGAQSEFRPSVVVPGQQGEVVVAAINLGNAAVIAGQPVRITDVLPRGIQATSIVQTEAGLLEHLGGAWVCSTSFPASVVTCEWSGGRIQPYEEIRFVLAIEGEAGMALGQEENEVRVSGGEGSIEGQPDGRTIAPVTKRQPVVVGKEATPFGLEDYQLTPEGEGGEPDTQAGSHPFQLTTTIALNESGNVNQPPALAKDVRVNWPAGLVGNPTPFPTCSEADFDAVIGFTNLCPNDTAVGVVALDFALAHGIARTYDFPLFSLPPHPGEPARFGFKAVDVPVTIDTAVRTGSDYGIVVTSSNISELEGLVYARVTVWGVPGDPSHDKSRGWSCLEGGNWDVEPHPPCVPLGESNPPPLLTLPTSCTGPLQSTIQADSWKEPGVFVPVSGMETIEPMVSLDGCGRLPFAAGINVVPDVPEASSPTGLSVKVHVPQDASLAAQGLADADVKDTAVTLPAGVTINPAGADGLESCSDAEIGFTGVDPASGTDLFTSGLPAPIGAPAQPFCPQAAKIGTVKIQTPLLPNPLEGAVYLASQNENPFGSLVAMYIVAEDPISGVLVKLPGEVALDPVTGQIVATFKNTPQDPFENVELDFFGGARAPLATPAQCGSYKTVASFTPWSGNAPVEATSTFQITSGPNGSPCRSPLVFAPSLAAGTTSIQAGGFSPFTMTMSREDGEQNLQGIQLHMPLGLSGTLSTVKLCGEEQADAGTCGPESLIGETTVSVGLGGDPFSVTGGKVYITGPYKGAPFGLSIVNPAKAGPYNLGQVVVRAKLEINEETAAITVTTDTEGPYKIPTILDGIPLEIKHVNVNINRPGFTFNATNCNPLQITGTLTSTEGATSALSVPYQVTNCAVLAFKPKLEASTSGKTSRTEGASLHVKLGYPAGPYDANIARVKVELPKALPSRLTTLQKACTVQVFEANPAACPAASIVGHATAVTPELPVPLTGPAYFVSHGGEAFPSLIIVLQGYGVTVHLVGSTFINEKTGVTSSTFKTVPDAPVGSFELTLPEGPYSALGANKDLCKTKLAMPTEFVGQNGTLIQTTTKIAVTGCGKVKKVSHKHKKSKAKRAARRRARKRR
jgi:hypothetical protein